MPLVVFLIFIISYFLHMTARVPALAVIRFDLVLGILVLLFGVFSKPADDDRFKLTVTKRLLLFLGYVLLSLPLVTWPGSVVKFHLIPWIKVALFLVLLLLTVKTTKQLKLVIVVFVGCQVFRALEPLYMHITTGYWGDIAYSMGGSSSLDRLAGSPYDIVNANQLAWVIVTALPFLYYLLGYAGTISKILLVCVTPPLVYALLLTGSRSGLLCLVFTVFAIVWVSENRKKAFTVAMIIFIPVSIYAASQLSDDMFTRYLSLVDSTVAGADTAQGRVDGIVRGIGSISNNPLFGNGLGTSGETNHNVLGGSAQITHNLYLEILQETGLIGFTLFALTVVAMLKALKIAQANLEEQGLGRKEWLYRLILATRVWIYMDLFYSLSCFGVRSWEWYFFGGVSTLCLVFSQKIESTNKKSFVSKDGGRFNAVPSSGVDHHPLL